MRGFILNNGFYISKSQDYKRNRLKDEFLKQGVEVDLLTSTEINFYMENSKLYIRGIEKYDFCVFLDKDENLAYAIQEFIPVFNSPEALSSCNDKMETYIKLANSGIITPKTIPSLLCYNRNPSQDAIDAFLNNVETELDYPFICKQCYGSLGLEVYLINNRQELEEIYVRLLKIPHVYQEYIENFKGKDYRVFTVGGKAVASMLRQNDDDFRSNIFLGGKGHAVVLPQHILDVAERASKILKLDYAGCDILINKDNQPTLIEVNSNAFLSEIEKVSKVNITEKLVKHVLNQLHSA